MKFQKLSIGQLPFEEIHSVKNARKTLATGETTGSKYLDAITKGFLESGEKFDWHLHEEIVEIGIVLYGQGKVYCEEEVQTYNADDVYIIPSGAKHKWEADSPSEYFFIRVVAK